MEDQCLACLECLGVGNVEVSNRVSIYCKMRVMVGGLRRWIYKVRRENQTVQIRRSVNFACEEGD